MKKDITLPLVTTAFKMLLDIAKQSYDNLQVADPTDKVLQRHDYETLELIKCLSVHLILIEAAQKNIAKGEFEFVLKKEC